MFLLMWTINLGNRQHLAAAPNGGQAETVGGEQGPAAGIYSLPALVNSPFSCQITLFVAH